MGIGPFSHWLSESSAPSKPIGAPSSGPIRPGKVTQLGHADFHPYVTPTDYKEIVARIEKVEKINERNPRADRYHIEKSLQVGTALILYISYPNCTNYEGRKVLVYKDMTLDRLMVLNHQLIDPHFSDSPKFISPIARFVPTDEGVRLAIELAELLSRDY